MKPPKLVVTAADMNSYPYPNLYERQSRSAGYERLVIAPSGRHAKLMGLLCKCLPEPLQVLYVLMAPQNPSRSPGRYESTKEFSVAEAQDFLQTYSEFLEHDGRHHVWVTNPECGALVYDRHDIIYAYGPIEEYVAILRDREMQQGTINLPLEHGHMYYREFNAVEDSLLAAFEWEYAPLQEEDEG